MIDIFIIHLIIVPVILFFVAIINSGWLREKIYEARMQSAFSSFLMPGRLKKKEDFFKQLKILATLGIVLFIIVYLMVISEYLFKGISMGHP